MLFALVPVAFVSLVVPDLFFSNFGTFLAFIGVFFAPVCAIQIVDYLILRRQRIEQPEFLQAGDAGGLLGHRHQVIAPEISGYGDSAMPAHAAATLADEGIEFGRLPWIPRGN